MKKFFALLLALVMALGLLAGCGDKTDGDNTGDTDGAKKIETLKVAFVPSREPEEIITVTEPLKQMLKDELAKQGYEVGDVEITVGTTYEAVGEGLEAGTIDVDGTVYSWRVSAIALSSVYDISGLPDTAVYVGIRLYA